MTFWVTFPTPATIGVGLSSIAGSTTSPPGAAHAACGGRVFSGDVSPAAGTARARTRTRTGRRRIRFLLRTLNPSSSLRTLECPGDTPPRSARRVPAGGPALVRGVLRRADGGAEQGLAADPRRAARRCCSRRPARARRSPRSSRRSTGSCSRPSRRRSERCRVLYVSPLKALAVDVERNLRAPLAGIARGGASGAGRPFRVPTVAVRSGDTPAGRARAHAPHAARHPDHDARVALPAPDVVARARSSPRSRPSSSTRSTRSSRRKRGAHLFLSLERLEALRAGRRVPLQRIGLSATQRPLEEVARLLGGGEVPGGEAACGSRARSRSSTRAAARRSTLTVEVPVEDMARLGEIDEIPSRTRRRTSRAPLDLAVDPPAPGRAHPRAPLDDDLRQQPAARRAPRGRAQRDRGRGDRARAPRLGRAREAAGDRGAAEARRAARDRRDVLARARDRHGRRRSRRSRSRRRRRSRRASSASAARATRSAPCSRGVIFPKYRGDLLACAAATARHARRARSRRRSTRATRSTSSPSRSSRSPRWTEIDVEELYALVRRAAPFAELPRALVRGRARHALRALPVATSSPSSARASRGTGSAGEVARARGRAARRGRQRGHDPGPRPLRRLPAPGRRTARERAAASASSTRRWSSSRGRATSSCSARRRGASRRSRTTGCSSRPRPGEPGKMPFWHGDRPGRPLEFGTRDRRARAHARAPSAGATRPSGSRSEHGLDARAAANLVAYLSEQAEATGEVPSDRTIVVERYLDEIGDCRVCVLSPFGARVHAPWATAVARAAARKRDGAATSRRSGPTTGSSSACRSPTSRPTSSLFLPAAGRGRGPRRRAASARRRSSPRASARTRRARCSCRGATRASDRRSGRSASAPPICSRSRRATARSRSCSRRTASACATCSICPALVDAPAPDREPAASAS